MKIYKYHIYLYNLYTAFHKEVFCTGEVYKSIPPIAHSFLFQKNLIKRISRKEAEGIREDIKKWKNFNWSFWIISAKGIELAEYVRDNQDQVAKKLLQDLSKGRIF